MDKQTNKRMVRNNKLQEICRDYLTRLKPVAKKHGMLKWVTYTIKSNKRNKCKATTHEVELLARCVNDERVLRRDIAPMLGKSYRQAFEDGDYEKIKQLPQCGKYSKVDALLYNEEIKNNV